MQTVDTGTDSFRPITYSRRDTCETQRQIAAHNSVYDTLRQGRRVVYAAPCDAAPGQPAAKEARTS